MWRQTVQFSPVCAVTKVVLTVTVSSKHRVSHSVQSNFCSAHVTLKIATKDPVTTRISAAYDKTVVVETGSSDPSESQLVLARLLRVITRLANRETFSRSLNQTQNHQLAAAALRIAFLQHYPTCGKALRYWVPSEFSCSRKWVERRAVCSSERVILVSCLYMWTSLDE